MTVRAVPPSRRRCPLPSRLGVGNGERAGAERLLSEARSWVGASAPSAARACLPHTPLQSSALRTLQPRSFSRFSNN